jgi:predicted membrane-bound spermidine synthase
LGIRRIRSSDRPPFRALATIEFLLALSGPALIFLVSLLSRVSGGASALLAAQLVFPVLAAAGGVLGGYQFPVATEIYLGERGSKGGLGTLYALDLFGGSVGALLLSTYLIPVFGFWKTAWLSLAVNLAPALLAARATLEARTDLA